MGFWENILFDLNIVAYSLSLVALCAVIVTVASVQRNRLLKARKK
jgi:hypothetical protein